MEHEPVFNTEPGPIERMRGTFVDAPSTDYTTCSASGKRGYSSPEKARRRSRGVGHKLRVYRCRDCKRWHVAKSYG